METSRDDFIIAVRSAFLKKGAAQRFSLFVLIIISIILLSLEYFKTKPLNIIRSISKDIIYRGSYIVSLPSKSLNNIYIVTKEHLDVYKENKILKKEIVDLKSEKNEIKFLRLQNNELKIAIEDHLKKNIYNVLAKVIIDKQSPFLKSIIINKGSKSKIKKGMAVLNKNNMIGRVVEVNYLSSRVLLISDLNSKIPVKIEPSGESAIMTGSGDSLAKLNYLPKKTKIYEGNLVYTSGSDGIFLDGIPIGKIVKFIDPSTKKASYSVDFLTDLTQAYIVNVLNYDSKESW